MQNIIKNQNSNVNHFNLTTTQNELLTANSTHNSLLTLYIFLIILAAAHVLYFFSMVIYVYFRNKKISAKEVKYNLRKLNQECAICLETLKNETQLVCSHSFCAECIVDYGKHKFGMNNLLCPVCRTETPKLFPQFEKNEENKLSLKEIENYNYVNDGHYKTSFVLTIDSVKLLNGYLKKLLNRNDHRYNTHRTVATTILCILTLVLILFLLPQGATSVIGDICYYYLLIILVRSIFRNNSQAAEVEYNNENENANNQEFDDFGNENVREDPRNLV